MGRLPGTHAMVAADVANGSLFVLDLGDDPKLVVRPGIVTLRERTPSPMASVARDCIEQVAKSL